MKRTPLELAEELETMLGGMVERSIYRRDLRAAFRLATELKDTLARAIATGELTVYAAVKNDEREKRP